MGSEMCIRDRGGNTCDSQPRCSGDAVQCAQLVQLWRVRCEQGEASSGDLSQCSTPFECEGDAIQCARSRFIHDQHCAGEAYAADTANLDIGHL